MALVYDDINKSPFQGRGSIYDMDPHKAYLKHYANYLYLSFIQQKGNRLEKHQATKELTICERKLNFWKRHPKWFADIIASDLTTLKQQWEGK